MAVNERNAGAANGSAERDPRLERLYREAAREAPPTHLDAAILAAARREVGARPHALAPALRRWHVPVSIAAVIVVSVSLVILVRDERPMLMMGDERAAMPSKERQVPEEGSRRREQAAGPPTQETPARTAKAIAQPPTAAPSPPRRESDDDARISKGLMALDEQTRRLRESEPSPVPGAGDMMKPAAMAAPPQVAEERAAPAPTATAGRMADAPAAPVESPAAPSAADTPPLRALARAAPTKVVEQDRQPVWHGFEKEPPEKWLAQVEELRRQGRTADAEEMLVEFKRRFPQHPLPLSSK